MGNSFFAMVSRMKYINRWGLMRNTINENIAEHSLEVAMISHSLAVISNVYFQGNIDPERAAILGLFHDTTEIITGDMPTPIKYFAPEIKNAYKNVEHIAAGQLLNELPEEMKPFYKDILMENQGEKELWRIVKAADKLSAYIKCIEEKRMGNEDFAQAEHATLQAVKDMNMREVEFFLEKFIPSYNLTLDDTVNK